MPKSKSESSKVPERSLNPFVTLLAVGASQPEANRPADPPAVIPLPEPPSPDVAAPLKRGTFQIRSRVLDALDRYHLQLQLDRGKNHAPYKETIVEAAIVHFLNSAQAQPGPWLKLLDRWQVSRRRSPR